MNSLKRKLNNSINNSINENKILIGKFKQGGNNLYLENYRIWLKEIKDINK